MPAIVSINGDQRGESALAHLPRFGTPREELLIAASGLSHVDTFTGIAVRALVEYYGRSCQQSITFCPPAKSPVWSMLSTLVGRDLPKHFALADGAGPPRAAARAVVLPTQRVETLAVTRLLSDGMIDLVGDAYGKRNASMLAAAFGVFVENALVHGGESPIGALAAISHERETHALQLVVTDLGAGLVAEEEPEAAVIEMVERSETGFHGLAGLVADARKKGIDFELRIASGGGRLAWGEGPANVFGAQAVPGFTAAGIIHLD